MALPSYPGEGREGTRHGAASLLYHFGRGLNKRLVAPCGDRVRSSFGDGLPGGADAIDSRATFHGIAIHEVARRLAEIARPVPLACTVGLTLGAALLALRRFGVAPRWWQLLPLLVGLALIVVLDLRSRIIPDVITLPGLVYALGLAAVSARSPTLIEAGLGALVGGGVVILVAIVSRGGIGGGDIKLMAMLGAALGWSGALAALALSQVAAALVVLGLLVVRRARPARHLPVGALIALFGAVLLIYSP